MKRRRFLSLLALGSSSLLLGSGKIILKERNINIYKKEFALISDIQEFIFPSNKGYLGAKEFNSIGYIETMTKYNIFKNSEVRYLIFGANSFDFRVRSKYGKPFSNLSLSQKDKFFKWYINQSKRNLKWIEKIKIHTLYALMSDPIYGGNKNQVGWKWLNITPPNPRPKVRMGRWE